MVRKSTIPNEVRTEVERSIANLNCNIFRNTAIAYSVHYRGEYICLKHNESGDP